MTEKVAINDVLSSINSLIKLCGYAIEQANNKNFRDEIVTTRNKLEDLQWKIYLISKSKGYYVPAAPAGEADIEQVKNAISK
jgi:hypothetical protein